MDTPSILQQYLREWADWDLGLRAPPKVIKQFTNGTRNRSFLIHCQQKPYVLRVFEAADASTLNPAQESLIQATVASLQLAPGIVYLAANASYRIEEYIDGRNPGALTVKEEGLRTLCRGIQRYQSIDMSSSATLSELAPRNYTQDLQTYWKAINPKVRNLPEWKQRHDWAIKLCDNYQALYGAVRCLSHHDLSPGNIIWQEKTDSPRCVFIDWEFAGRGIPSFDFGTLIAEFNIPVTTIADLVVLEEKELSMAASVYKELCAFYYAAHGNTDAVR